MQQLVPTGRVFLIVLRHVVRQTQSAPPCGDGTADEEHFIPNREKSPGARNWAPCVVSVRCFERCSVGRWSRDGRNGCDGGTVNRSSSFRGYDFDAWSACDLCFFAVAFQTDFRGDGNDVAGIPVKGPNGLNGA